tara:strand:+ start:12936 stop:13166 length:231 start_codon:yes stop_codon:yes gene_type:complete
MAEVHYEYEDGTKVPNHIEFRGYDYTIHSIHREGMWMAHIDDAEDNARIEAMHIRRDGGRACVKRINDTTWAIYWR